MKVKEKSTKTIFAAKMFSKEPIENKPKEVQLLRNEIMTNNRLSHPLIAEMYEFHETEGSIYLIFEHLKGTPIISSRTPTLKTSSQVKETILCLLTSLSYLEEKGIVHRDLKPYNILYEEDQHQSTKNPTLKLIDFGLAERHYNSHTLYRQCGTPGFIAPEVFNTPREHFSNILNSKIDIFSVGVIFHYLTFAVYPFGEDESDVIFDRNKKGLFKISDIGEHVLDLEDKLGYKLMTMMLECNPEKRPTVGEALKHPYFLKSKISNYGGTTKILESYISAKAGKANRTGGFMNKVFDSKNIEEGGDDESEFDLSKIDEGRLRAIRNFGMRSMMPKNKFKENKDKFNR